jgi:dienelactone hydrolase
MNVSTLLLTCLVSFGCTSGGLDGRWVADARSPRGSMTLILDIGRNGDGPSVLVTVPAERVLGLRATEIELDPPTLAFLIPHPDHPMRFAGRADGDVLAGALSTSGEQMELSFRRSGPVPALPYRELPVSFEGAGRLVEGTLLVPPGNGPHPAMVWFHATSTANRDSLRSYADLAARAGVASLIYDRREVPIDVARLPRADFLDVVADAEAAVRFLRERGEIDRGRVGAGGLSQGAWIAAIVAARMDGVGFVVALSCPGVPLHEIDEHQSRLRLARLGLPPEELARACELLADLHAASRGELGDPDSLAERLRVARDEPWASTLDLPDRIPSKDSSPALLRWSAQDLDPRYSFERIRVPVLIAFGGRDERLPAALCAEQLRSSLARAGNTSVRMLDYPEADHALLPAPELERDLDEWLRGVAVNP